MNRNANSSLSKVGATLVMLSLAAGCGSVAAQSSNDGGPNDGKRAILTRGSAAWPGLAIAAGRLI